MNQATSSLKKDNADSFKPVNLHGKAVMIVVGILLLSGFIFLLIRYAQPTPAGVSVNGRPKTVAVTAKSPQAGSNFQTASSDQLTAPQGASTSGTSGNTSTSSSTASTALQPSITAKNPISIDTSAQTAGPVTQLVQTVQSTLPITGLVTGLLH